MLIHVYRTEPFTPSVLRASLIAEVEVDRPPEDTALFADRYGGDFVEIAPLDDPNDDKDDPPYAQQDGNSQCL